MAKMYDELGNEIEICGFGYNKNLGGKYCTYRRISRYEPSDTLVANENDMKKFKIVMI